jgi:hypothetical protein
MASDAPAKDQGEFVGLTDTLAALREEHTASGTHRVRTIPFPRWVPSEVRQAAENISEEEALRQLGDWVRVYLRRGPRSAS